MYGANNTNQYVGPSQYGGAQNQYGGGAQNQYGGATNQYGGGGTSGGGASYGNANYVQPNNQTFGPSLQSSNSFQVNRPPVGTSGDTCCCNIMWFL